MYKYTSVQVYSEIPSRVQYTQSMVSLQCQLHLLSQQIHAPDARNHQYNFKCISASTTAYKESFYPKQFPSGTNLTKKPPRQLPSTASKVVCTSSPSPFVDVIPHIGSLSTTFQIRSGDSITRHVDIRGDAGSS